MEMAIGILNTEDCSLLYLKVLNAIIQLQRPSRGFVYSVISNIQITRGKQKTKNCKSTSPYVNSPLDIINNLSIDQKLK